MIRDLGNYNLCMYAGDTGTISFKMAGDCKDTDSYMFVIRKSLDEKPPLFSQTFNCVEFTVFIDAETTKLLPEGSYLWGIKLLRDNDGINTIDTIVGCGKLNVKRGV